MKKYYGIGVFMRQFFYCICILIFCYPLSGYAKNLKITTTIKPIESLIAYIIDSQDSVSSIVSGNYSHHNFALKPSHVRKIYQSDIVVFINPNFETFMRTSYKIIPEHAKIVTLSNTPHLEFLTLNKDHNLSQNLKKDTDLVTDYHIWLTPKNALLIVQYLKGVLCEANPEKCDIYQKNTLTIQGKLEELNKKIQKQLTPIKEVPFMVFHNAYQYFIKEYQLNYIGAITRNPVTYSSIKYFKEVQNKLQKNNVHCIFKEPQFDDSLVKRIVKDDKIKIGILDPLGGEIQDGKQYYFKLIENITQNLHKCLQSS